MLFVSIFIQMGAMKTLGRTLHYLKGHYSVQTVGTDILAIVCDIFSLLFENPALFNWDIDKVKCFYASAMPKSAFCIIDLWWF